MIRWRLVIHAGVDGFSRCVVYIKCANNNRAETVLGSFLQGLSTFGTPDWVRSDHGGENIDVWRHMLSIHNDPSCVVTGSSTHNERVERLWRDVYRDVSSAFVDTFKALEEEHMLDPLNEVDIFCLHFVFQPRINKCLCDFQGAWNHHALSTEGNMSLYQLFVEGSCMDRCEDEPQQTNSDLSAPNPPFDVTECVQVPSNKFEPCSHLSTLLLSSVYPLTRCDDFGKSLYYRAVQLIGQHLQTGCSNCQLE